jgi:hypothetical protein
LEAPRYIGRYEVIDLIGHGGMGSLYRARDPHIGRHVAIKLLREGYDNQDLRQRLAHEAKSAGRLTHPNIVTIYDVGEHEGRPFIAMEHVPGKTFADLIGSRQPLPLSRKLQLIEDVCAGLSHAHEAGITHRDIKPANLMVRPDGSVKILDFGIARLTASGMTKPGMLMGTLSYMAPEQLGGSEVDTRADVFAVGAVLYELLSGRQAFPGEIDDGLLYRILNSAPVPLRELCPGLDPRIIRIVDQALEKRPERRFQKLSIMQQELAQVRQRQRDPEAPALKRVAPEEDATSLMPPPIAVPPKPPTSGTDRANLARLRAQQIEAHLVTVKRAFDAADYDAALTACELVMDSDEPRAVAWLDKIHEALDERQLRKWLAEARQHLEDGATTMASELLSRAVALSPNHPDIAKVREAIETERNRARVQAARGALDRARDAYQHGQLRVALRELAQVFVLDPDNSHGRELKAAVDAAIEVKGQEERARATVDEAYRRFGTGDYQGAIASLEALGPRAPASVAGTLQDFRSAYDGIVKERQALEARLARQRRVAALFSEARAALTRREFALARDFVREIRDLDPNAAGLADLIQQIQRNGEETSAAAGGSSQLEAMLAEIDERIAGGDLVWAQELVRSAGELVPQEPRVVAVQSRLERALAERATLERAASELDNERAQSMLFESEKALAATQHDDWVSEPLQVLPTDTGELGQTSRKILKIPLWMWGIGIAAVVIGLVVGRWVGAPAPAPVTKAPPVPTPVGGNDNPPPITVTTVTPDTIAVQLTGEYPFEVVLPNGTSRRADKTHQFSLPNQADQTLRLRNFEYFLSASVRVQATDGQMNYAAPALSTLNVSNTWDETCDIEIDGRRAGYHPLRNKRIVAGRHSVSVRCPDGRSTSTTVSVREGGGNTVTFRKQD